MNDARLIFERTDSDGDQIRVVTGIGSHFDCLYLKNTNNDQEMNTVRLDRADVRSLHSALGVWLSENGIIVERTPEPATHVDERVTAEDVRRIALDELSKFVIEADYPAQIKEAVRHEFRNFLTRAIEMGVDQ